MRRHRDLIDRAFGTSRKHRVFRGVVFAAILLPVLAVVTTGLSRLRDALTEREAARAQAVIQRDQLYAHAVANGIAIYVGAALDAVRTASASASRRELTPAELDPLITDLVKNTSSFFAASIGNASGTGIVTYDPNGAGAAEQYRRGLDLSGRNYYLALAASNTPVVSDALTSLVARQPTFAVAAPILGEDGRMTGFVAAGVSLEPLYRLALSELGDGPAIPVAVDRLGQVIVHPDKELVAAHLRLDGYEPAARALRGETGYLDAFTDVDGRTRSAAYAPVPGLGWGVWIAQEPGAGAAAFIRRELLGTGAFYAAVFLIDLLLAFLLWRMLRALHAMVQKERAFLGAIADGVVAVDRDWKLILWNAAATRLTGWNADEAMGQPFRSRVRLLRERDRKENLAFIEEAMLFGESRPMANSTLLVRRDGREIPVSESASPLYGEDGTPVGAVVIFRDVTREKDDATLRSDFAYASHQLRTPVNKALWDLELAIEDAPPAVREKLGAAHGAVRDVHKMANRLVEVSQVDQKQLIPSYANVKASGVVAQAVALAKAEADARKVTVFVKPLRDEILLETDGKLLAAALRELIANAALYNGKERAVDVVVQAEGPDVVFQVMDRGIGISEEQKPLVFTKFFRGQNVPADAHGAGLGLFIARSYLQLLGGRIWFDSRLGLGTTFTVSVPRARPSK